MLRTQGEDLGISVGGPQTLLASGPSTPAHVTERAGSPPAHWAVPRPEGNARTCLSVSLVYSAAVTKGIQCSGMGKPPQLPGLIGRYC